MQDNTVLAVQNISKSFGSEANPISVLRDISFALHAGESAALVGRSGSGKSTLLALCAGLDVPSSGTILLDGQRLAELGDDERAILRTDFIGFVFQSYNLVPTLTALENVMLPAELVRRGEALSAAKTLLCKVGLESRYHHFPHQLSGGEQQRVALARAFINRPRLILADEPTGNLDRENRHLVLFLLRDLQRDHQSASLIATHDTELAGEMDSVLHLRDGALSQ